jgi:predicted dinucleotide-binding enzyme
MRIGIIGAGSIGIILARRLSRAGHEVRIANSRAPESIKASALSTGATPVWAADATAGAEVVIVSLNLEHIPSVADLIAQAPAGAVVIDTSNYFPNRNGVVQAIEDGQVESSWVQEQYRRPIVKAWNTIGTDSLAELATEPGAPGRVALPVSSDDPAHRAIGMVLVEQTGFDAVDAGTVADSWRQQPGTPAYVTNLTATELAAALATADRTRSPFRRDLMVEAGQERIEAEGSLSRERHTALARAIF